MYNFIFEALEVIRPTTALSVLTILGMMNVACSLVVSDYLERVKLTSKKYRKLAYIITSILMVAFLTLLTFYTILKYDDGKDFTTFEQIAALLLWVVVSLFLLMSWNPLIRVAVEALADLVDKQIDRYAKSDDDVELSTEQEARLAKFIAQKQKENLAKEVELAKIQAEKEEMADLIVDRLYERLKADKEIVLPSETESTTD